MGSFESWHTLSSNYSLIFDFNWIVLIMFLRNWKLAMLVALVNLVLADLHYPFVRDLFAPTAIYVL
jgi:hypothetical protein